MYHFIITTLKFILGICCPLKSDLPSQKQTLAMLILLPKYSANDKNSHTIENKIIILGYILIYVYCSDKSEFSDVFEFTSYIFVCGTHVNSNQIIHKQQTEKF